MPIQINPLPIGKKILNIEKNYNKFNLFIHISHISKSSQPLLLIQQHAVFLLSWTSHCVSSFLTEVGEILSYHSSEIVLNLINLDLFILQ